VIEPLAGEAGASAACCVQVTVTAAPDPAGTLIVAASNVRDAAELLPAPGAVQDAHAVPAGRARTSTAIKRHLSSLIAPPSHHKRA
jgi:hypothetical protein